MCPRPKPDDLTCAHVEGDALDRLQSAVVEHMDVLHLQERLPGGRGGLLDPQEDLAADHHAGQPSLRRTLVRHGANLLSAPEHSDPVGDLEHLVQLVADEDDREALARERPEDLEELAGLLRCQHCRRLVEDQDVRAAIERLQDLDSLLLAHADVLDPCLWIDREVEGAGEMFDAPVRGAVIEQHAGMGRLAGQDDVLRHRHHRDQHEVLVHHSDAARDRVLGRVDSHRLALDPDLALVRVVEPVEDVHQRRLSGAVLAEQRVNLAPAKIEVDVVVGEDPREVLRDPAELEDRPLVVDHVVILGGGTAPAP